MLKQRRQRSVLDESRPAHARALKIDPDNRLLWRQRMRRLEAEPMRDALLATSGKLSRSKAKDMFLAGAYEMAD